MNHRYYRAADRVTAAEVLALVCMLAAAAALALWLIDEARRWF